MATLKTNTLTGTSTAGSIAVTGEGNSTTTNLQQGLCKVWNAIDQKSGIATDDSFNVSGTTDDATANSTHSFTNNMNNVHYVVTATERNANQDGGWHTCIFVVGAKSASDYNGSQSTSQHSLMSKSHDGSTDRDTESGTQITGDLA
jgi:hypothetical protein